MASYLSWDVGTFISEVKKYPELWDTNSEEYRFRDRKQRAWGEIAKVFVEDYDDLSARERDDLFKKFIGKWRNIKDSYVRHTKRKYNSKKGYLYAKQLSFLDDVYKATDASDEDEQRDDTWPSDDDGKLKKILFKSMFQKDDPMWQNEDSSELAKKRKTDIEFVETSTEASYVVDEDKSFFDSLLPAVREFTLDQKLEFRTDVIKLVKTYRKNGRRSRTDSD